jgi:hypothetical protein
MDVRQYDNALGRFHSVDLLAEVDYSGSPYSFGFNNPVYFSDPSGLTPQGGDQQPQSGCTCKGTCVCLSTVDIQGWVRPTSASYTIFQSADNRSVSVNIQPSYGSQERSGGGGVSSLTPAGLIALNSAVIEAAKMKNVVGVAGNSTSSQNTSNNKTYDSWFFTNQYFALQSGVRVGTFVDFSPLKKFYGVVLGEYSESGYTAEYYQNQGKVSPYENRLFELGASYVVGANFKYNLDKDRFESF